MSSPEADPVGRWGWSARLSLAGFGGLLLAAEATSFRAFSIGTAGALEWAILHGLCCAAAAVATFLTRRRPEAFGLSVQLVLWTAVTGAFGLGIWLLQTLFGKGSRPDGLPTAWIDGHAAPDEDRLTALRGRLVDNRLRIEGASRVLALRDVLGGADQTTKLKALSLMARDYNPGLAPALRRALQDEDAAVRVMAASVLSRLQYGHAARLEALKTPATAAGDSILNWVNLGKAHRDFVRSGLLTAERAAEEAEKARACLAHAAALRLRERASPRSVDQSPRADCPANEGGENGG